MAGQFDETLKTFKGFDDEGNPVFGDDATGEFNSLDKEEYSDLAAEAKTQFGEKKFSDSFQDYQAKKITEDKDFLGNDNEGNSVFKNKAGIIDRAKLNFKEGLNRQFGDKSFTKANEGLNNQKIGENRITQAPILRTNNSAQGNLNNRQAIPTIQSPSPGYNPSGSLNQPKQANWNQNPNYFSKQAQKAIDKDVEETEEEPQQEEITQPEPSVSKQLMGIAKQEAVDYTKDKATQFGKDQANKYVPENVKALAGGIKDPRALAEQQAKAYGKLQLQNALQNSGYGQYANALGGGVKSIKDVQALIKDPSKIVDAGKAIAIDYGKNALKNAVAGSQYGGVASGAVDALLNYKQVLQDPKEYAKKLALDQAKYQAGQLASGFTGGVNVAGLVDAFGKGGDKGDAVGRAAAMAAWTAATGGLGAVINPDTLQLASGLQSKAGDKLGNMGLGGAGNLAKSYMDVASAGTKLTADVGNEALGLAGGAGSDFFKNGEAFTKGSKDAVKKLSSGDIAGGLKGLGSTALKGAFNTAYKAPVQAVKRSVEAAKKIAGSVGHAISSIFCFTPDTLIIMADGSAKRIEAIKVGEKVALGGLVIAIGEALNQDLWIYNGVKVSGGHLVLENAEWVRVQDSSIGKKLPNKNKSIVIPMTNENHLIMTDNYQVWRDMDEVEDTFNKTDDDIVEELNGQQKLNKLLQEKTDELKKI